MNEQNSTRAKMLGVLIRDARRHAGRSVDECASVLQIAPEQFARAEAGDFVVSLPQLEVLSLYLDVPMAHFWGSQTLGESEEPDFSGLLALRQRIIGGLLRQARLESGRSPAELAEQIGVDEERIQQYERGREAIPYLELEELAAFLRVPMAYFVEDKHGPLARHEKQHKIQQRFNELPEEMREFIVRPANVNYIETAMRLSEMDADKLRTIATSLLDITY